jgi:hypothetical protein
MISEGHTFFCPTYADAGPSSPIYSLSADYYGPPNGTFMSTHVNGSIRSSYMYNPRLLSPVNGSLRAYQKVTDVKLVDVFAVDYIASGNFSSPDGTPTVPGVPFDAQHWSHWPKRGLPVSFTDGSARFVTLNPKDFDNIVSKLNSDPAGPWAPQYNALFNMLQNTQ